MLQEFTQEVENTARAVMNEIHTALAGEIMSFDAGSGTATVRPVGKFATSDGKELGYPLITEVPVAFPFCQQAGVGVAFPVHTGDSCIVIFSEVELDAWRSGAESEGPLRFDLTSAMAVPGLLEGGSALVAKAAERNAVVIGTEGMDIVVSSDGIEMDTGETRIEVSDSGMAVWGDLRVEGDIIYTGSCQPGVMPAGSRSGEV